jgi:hypothetical protein
MVEFPTYEGIVFPPVGTKVYATEKTKDICKNQGIPMFLEVKRHYIDESGCIIDLHYDDLTHQAYKQSNLLHKLF